jgi:hypothetical protein
MSGLARREEKKYIMSFFNNPVKKNGHSCENMMSLGRLGQTEFRKR